MRSGRALPSFTRAAHPMHRALVILRTSGVGTRVLLSTGMEANSRDERPPTRNASAVCRDIKKAVLDRAKSPAPVVELGRG